MEIFLIIPLKTHRNKLQNPIINPQHFLLFLRKKSLLKFSPWFQFKIVKKEHRIPMKCNSFTWSPIPIIKLILLTNSSLKFLIRKFSSNLNKILLKIPEMNTVLKIIIIIKVFNSVVKNVKQPVNLKTKLAFA